MLYKLPDLQNFYEISYPDKIEILNHLFEPCETLSSLVLDFLLSQDIKFISYKQFIETIRTILLDFLSKAELDASLNNKRVDSRVSKIIAAHPRLGASKPNNAEKLSEHSKSEQRSLQSGSEDGKDNLLALNDLYETTFPGLRYLVFVNGRSREVIMENIKQRISRNDISLERKEAFNAMCDIALDRAKKLGAKL